MGSSALRNFDKPSRFSVTSLGGRERYPGMGSTISGRRRANLVSSGCVFDVTA
jgi:hypothetical protein